MPLRRAERWGPLHGDFLEPRDLARFLRNVVTDYRRSLRRLADDTHYSKSTISERLNGAERPEWPFVETLIGACAGDDRQAADQLLRQARVKWEAADPSRLTPLPHEVLGGTEIGPPPVGADLLSPIMDRLEALDARLSREDSTGPAVAGTSGPPPVNAGIRPAEDGGDPPPTDTNGLPSTDASVTRLSDTVRDGGEAEEVTGPSGRSGPPASGPGLLCGRFPARAACFTGRDDVVASIGRGFATHAVQVVRGPLGVGKTQIAVEYTHAFRSAYDLIAWIPAEEPGSVRSSLAALAPYLGLAPAGTGEIGDVFRAVLSALSEGSHDERWLLVFDNADGPDRIQHLIPRRGGGDVLVTSRDPAWRSIPSGPRDIAIGTFTREESLLFLSERLNGEHTGTESRRLAEALGDLPLALAQAASLLNGRPLEIAEYLRGLADDVSGVLSDGDPSPYPMPMTTAWALSAGRLGERSFDALSLLRHCAPLGAGPISLTDLRAAHGTADTHVAELLADPIRLSGALQELSRIGLSTLDEARRTIEIHVLIRALVRDEPLDLDERTPEGA